MQGHERLSGFDAVISGTDDLVAVGKLFKPMRRPARDAGYGEHGRIERLGQIEHGVDESRIKIDVGADRAGIVVQFGHHLRGQGSDAVIQLEFPFFALFHGQFSRKFFENLAAGVGFCVNGVSHAVNQAALIENFFAQDLIEIILHRIARPVLADVCLDVLEHQRHLQVGAAVFGPLQRTEGGGDGGIGIRSGGRDDVRREGGVVAAAVFGVDDQADVQRLGFQVGEFIVPPQDVQDILRAGIFFDGSVNNERRTLIIAACAMAVDGKQGELCDELEGLAQDVFDVERVGGIVERIEIEHAAREHIHDVGRGRFHDDVAHKGLRQFAQIGKQGGKIGKLFFGGENAEEEKVYGFFKTETVFLDAVGDDVAHVDAAVEKFPVDFRFYAVNDSGSVDFGHFCQPAQNARALTVAQAAFDVVHVIQSRIDDIFLSEAGKIPDQRGVCGFHRIVLLPLSFDFFTL